MKYITIRIEKTADLERVPFDEGDLEAILQMLNARNAKAIALNGDTVIAET